MEPPSWSPGLGRVDAREVTRVASVARSPVCSLRRNAALRSSVASAYDIWRPRPPGRRCGVVEVRRFGAVLEHHPVGDSHHSSSLGSTDRHGLGRSGAGAPCSSEEGPSARGWKVTSSSSCSIRRSSECRARLRQVLGPAASGVEHSRTSSPFVGTTSVGSSNDATRTLPRQRAGRVSPAGFGQPGTAGACHGAQPRLRATRSLRCL